MGILVVSEGLVRFGGGEVGEPRSLGVVGGGW